MPLSMESKSHRRTSRAPVTIASHGAAAAEVLEAHRRAVEAAPGSGVAEHNHAAALGDLGYAEAAQAAALRALAKGLDAPETWLVLARARLALNRFADAEAALAGALRRRPGYAEAHRELAQLLWMQTGDLNHASRSLDAALATTPPPAAELVAVKTSLLVSAGRTAEAAAFADRAVRAAPGVLALRLLAARLHAQHGDPATALDHAEAAARQSPGEPAAAAALCEAFLACGRPAEAERLSGFMLEGLPFDQAFLSYRTTAWRLLDDPRRGALLDYEHLVGASTLDTPDGWPTLASYLGDLAAELNGRHAFLTHPLDQSVRHGSQIANLQAIEHPVFAAFFQAVDGPIRRFLAALPDDGGPAAARAQGGYAFEGVWSVRLSSGGRHASHIHPAGWLSSACHIALPQESENAVDRQGWLTFGEPGVRTQPPLEPEYFLRPEVGRLVLFPSYMWHATIPFESEQPRLSIAFDLTPAPA